MEISMRKTFWSALLCLFSVSAYATDYGYFIGQSGTQTTAGQPLFSDLDTRKCDTFNLVSYTGSVEVLVSSDGTNFTSSAIKMEDLHNTTFTEANATTAGKEYGFAGKYRLVRVKQVGATASSATLNCWLKGGVNGPVAGISTTADVTVQPSSWTAVSTGSSTVRIRSNSYGRWFVAVSASGAPSGSLTGEIFRGEVDWQGSGLVGVVYVKVENPDHAFAISQ